MLNSSSRTKVPSALLVVALAACGGNSEEANAGATAAQAAEPKKATQAAGGLLEPCELLASSAVAAAFQMDASAFTMTPGYNSERESKTTRDCEWRANEATHPITVSYYVRKAGDQVPPDAMVQVFETTATNGESVSRNDTAQTSAIDLKGVDRALITEGHRETYTVVRGLIWLDGGKRLRKLFVTLSADDAGGSPPDISEEVLVSLFEASR